jgi:hypothetical protein
MKYLKQWKPMFLCRCVSPRESRRNNFCGEKKQIKGRKTLVWLQWQDSFLSFCVNYSPKAHSWFMLSWDLKNKRTFIIWPDSKCPRNIWWPKKQKNLTFVSIISLLAKLWGGQKRIFLKKIIIYSYLDFFDFFQT